MGVNTEVLRRLLALKADIDAIVDGSTDLSELTATNIKDSTRAYARATTNAAQSIPTGGASATVVNFGTVELDSRSAITTGAAWKYTVPTGHGGLYLVSAAVCFDTGAGTGQPELQLLKNGGSQKALCVGSLTAAISGLAGATVISLVAGDYIDIRLYQASGGARALTARHDFNHVSIVRLVTDL